MNRLRKLELIEMLLAVISLFSLIDLGIGVVASAVLAAAWGFGFTPQAHPLLWGAVMYGCLIGCAGLLVPYFILRFVVSPLIRITERAACEDVGLETATPRR